MFSTLGVLDYSHYLIAVIAVILLPGPNSLYVLQSGMRYGIRKGFQAAFAVFIGDGLIMFAAYLGIATLIRESPQLFMSMRYLSAAYLFYLAIQILYGTYAPRWRDRQINRERSTIKGQDSTHAPLRQSNHPNPNTEQTEENTFLKALTLSLTNPKAILFFFAFFHKFIDPTFSPTAIPFAILAITLTLVSASYLSLLIMGGAALVNFLRGHQWLGMVGNTLVALLFTLFTLQLILGN